MRNVFLVLSCCAGLLLSAVPGARAQAPVSNPAQVVLIFKSDPKEFGNMTLDKNPFAAPGLSKDFGSVWPVAGGKHELVVPATGAEEKKFPLETQPGGVTLLLLGLGKNPDAAKAAQFPKSVIATSLPLELKIPQKKSEVFAYIPPGGGTVNGELVHGNTDATKIVLPEGKLTSLGEGQTGLSVAGQPVIFASPGNAGAYVFVLLKDEKNKLHSVPFSFTIDEPEDPAKAQDNAGKALDY